MITAINTSPFHISYKRKKNTWYSVIDGNWNNPATWISNSVKKRQIAVPQYGDDVYIHHNVILNAALNPTIGNLRVNGNLTIQGNQNITILGDFTQSENSVIDLNNGNENIFLYGTNNYLRNVINAGTSTIYYYSSFSQDIQPIPYWNLISQNGPVRNVLADLVVANQLFIYGGAFNLYGFNLTVGRVNGSTPAGGATFIALGFPLSVNTTGGNHILVYNGGGLGSNATTSTFNLYGAPYVEFRGGTIGIQAAFNGNATWTFNTYNANINTDFSVSVVPYNITIDNVTLTTQEAVYRGNDPLTFSGVINGTTASSKFILGANTLTYLASPTLPMATGVFDPSTFGATSMLGLVQSSNLTIPWTTFSGGLAILTAGVTKTLSGNTTIGGQLFVNSGKLECNGYTLAISGVATTTGPSTTFSQNGPGALTFMSKWNPGANAVILLSGNPNIELQNGLGGDGVGASSNFGTGNWNITTNSQTLDFSFRVFTIAGNVTIAAGITATFTATGRNSNIPITGQLNGASSSSVAIFTGNAAITYKNANAPMITGLLYCNQGINTFIYGASGNQDIQVPSDPGTPGYNNLTLNGSGVKRLLGNVSVKGTYTLTAPVTLNSNGFTLSNP